MKKKNAYVSVAVFVMLIMTFTVLSLLKPDTAYSESEKRYLEKKPEASVKTIFDGTYTSDYEKYVTEQFVFRDEFIYAKTLCELAAGKKDINGVYLGKDDYLIEVHPASEINETLAFRNADRMIEFLNTLNGNDDIKSVRAMIVPTAGMILKDKLPRFAQTYDQNKIIDYMKKGLAENFIDVRDILSQHNNEYIYYRTDHHWTTYGAYLAYTQYAQSTGLDAYTPDRFNIKEVCDDFLGTLYAKIHYAPQSDVIQAYEAAPEFHFNVSYNGESTSTDTLYNEAALETSDQYTYFLNGNNAIVDIKSNADNDRTLLIIKDSYAHCFAPFAAMHYNRVVMIDMRYLKKPVSRIVEEYGITDVLVLYNAIHFSQDTNMSLLQ